MALLTIWPIWPPSRSRARRPPSTRPPARATAFQSPEEIEERIRQIRLGARADGAGSSLFHRCCAPQGHDAGELAVGTPPDTPAGSPSGREAPAGRQGVFEYVREHVVDAYQGVEDYAREQHWKSNVMRFGWSRERLFGSASAEFSNWRWCRFAHESGHVLSDMN